MSITIQCYWHTIDWSHQNKTSNLCNVKQIQIQLFHMWAFTFFTEGYIECLHWQISKTLRNIQDVHLRLFWPNQSSRTVWCTQSCRVRICLPAFSGCTSCEKLTTFQGRRKQLPSRNSFQHPRTCRSWFCLDLHHQPWPWLLGHTRQAGTPPPLSGWTAGPRWRVPLMQQSCGTSFPSMTELFNTILLWTAHENSTTPTNAECPTQKSENPCVCTHNALALNKHNKIRMT